MACWLASSGHDAVPGSEVGELAFCNEEAPHLEGELGSVIAHELTEVMHHPRPIPCLDPRQHLQSGSVL